MTPQLDLIGLVVADMATTLAFYRDLGLVLPTEADAQPHVEHTLPGGMRLAWDSEEVMASFDPGWAPSVGRSRAALAFRCADPHEVDQIAARMASAGHRVHLEPWNAFWGQRYAVLLDPDGVTVDLFAALSGAS